MRSEQDSGKVATANERERILGEFNPTAVAYCHDSLIHKVFEEQAARTPLTGTQWLDAPSFRNVIASLVRQWHTPEQLAVLPPVASADIRAAFYVQAPRPEAPPAIPGR